MVWPWLFFTSKLTLRQWKLPETSYHVAFTNCFYLQMELSSWGIFVFTRTMLHFSEENFCPQPIMLEKVASTCKNVHVDKTSKRKVLESKILSQRLGDGDLLRLTRVRNPQPQPLSSVPFHSSCAWFFHLAGQEEIDRLCAWINATTPARTWVMLFQSFSFFCQTF